MCARRCRSWITSANGWCRNYVRRSMSSRYWKRKSTPTCWAAWWCGSAIGSTTPVCAAVWPRWAINSTRAAVMRFKADEIASVLENEVSQYRDKVDTREVGRVLEVGDGIARVYGLSGVMAGEMVEFTRTKVRGLAFNLEENSVGLIILGNYLEITEGDEVHSTGALLRVPVGDALIGRVVDPLGNPMDGKGPILTELSRPVESYAPGVSGRQPVNVPLQTGIKAIDAMTPVGRGQRELIIGDRKTGKTAIAVDAIINQKGENVICVYVAIGQKESTVAGVVETLRAAGAMDYTVVIIASSAGAAALQYIAPYAG